MLYLKVLKLYAMWRDDELVPGRSLHFLFSGNRKYLEIRTRCLVGCVGLTTWCNQVSCPEVGLTWCDIKIRTVPLSQVQNVILGYAGVKNCLTLFIALVLWKDWKDMKGTLERCRPPLSFYRWIWGWFSLWSACPSPLPVKGLPV